MSIKIALCGRTRRLLFEFASASIGIAVAGEVVGFLFAGARYWSDLSYDISPHDPIVYGSVALFVFAISVAAALIPVIIRCRESVHIGLSHE